MSTPNEPFNTCYYEETVHAALEKFKELTASPDFAYKKSGALYSISECEISVGPFRMSVSFYGQYIVLYLAGVAVARYFDPDTGFTCKSGESTKAYKAAWDKHTKKVDKERKASPLWLAYNNTVEREVAEFTRKNCEAMQKKLLEDCPKLVAALNEEALVEQPTIEAAERLMQLEYGVKPWWKKLFSIGEG